MDALLAPFMTFVRGRAWLETLDLAAVRRALLVFEEAVSLAPDHAAAHVGLANACAMLFESTRTDAAPASQLSAWRRRALRPGRA